MPGPVSEALQFAPPLIVTWVAIYAVFWLLGLAPWPATPWRDRFADRWGSLDPTTLGGFSWWHLAVISFISLFLELLLVRWVTSEIRVFAYFQSLVLIACFLGFGLGCYLTRIRIRLMYTVLPLIFLVLLIELPWDPLRILITNLSGFIGWFSDVHIWSRAYFEGNDILGAISAGVAMSIVIPLFGLIALTFVPFGQFVGWYLANSRRGTVAYSVNVFASVLGIWLFTGLSFLSTPPVVWFTALGFTMVLFFWRLPSVRNGLVLAFAAIGAMFIVGTQATTWWGEQSWKGATEALADLTAGTPETWWSPYQKLTLIPLKEGNEVVRYVLNTNDSWYQQIMDLRPSAVNEHPELYTGFPVQYIQYNLPYQFYKDPPSVLVAGAGMGNDVAAALRNGAGHVTAVEIDPLIYAKGKAIHPEQPYNSPLVDFHVDDARSFIQNDHNQYDLVVFSILDSQTTSSYYTNIRLDNYVYTLEAMQATRKLLKPDGLFVMSFSSERPWFTNRLRDVLSRAFGKDPIMVQTNVAFFVIGPGSHAETALANDPNLNSFVSQHSDMELQPSDLTTDDWPYLYQQFRGIPVIVWVLSIGLVLMSWFTFRRLRGRTSTGFSWHFFWLGAAFMLLEVQAISKVALLFGTTWLVNSIVISVILLFILLSNLVAGKWPNLRREVAYVGLLVALALNFLIPTDALFVDSLMLRGLLATGLYCAPVFFAGLVFISSFRRMGYRAEAFGANLLGSLVGGLLLSLSYWTGIDALVLVAGLLYLLSFVTMGRATAAETDIDAEAAPGAREPLGALG
jgi:SAM-dependent methyltransferase